MSSWQADQVRVITREVDVVDKWWVTLTTVPWVPHDVPWWQAILRRPSPPRCDKWLLPHDVQKRRAVLRHSTPRIRSIVQTVLQPSTLRMRQGEARRRLVTALRATTQFLQLNQDDELVGLQRVLDERIFPRLDSCKDLPKMFADLVWLMPSHFQSVVAIMIALLAAFPAPLLLMHCDTEVRTVQISNDSQVLHLQMCDLAGNVQHEVCMHLDAKSGDLEEFVREREMREWIRIIVRSTENSVVGGFLREHALLVLELHVPSQAESRRARRARRDTLFAVLLSYLESRRWRELEQADLEQADIPLVWLYQRSSERIRKSHIRRCQVLLSRRCQATEARSRALLQPGGRRRSWARLAPRK